MTQSVLLVGFLSAAPLLLRGDQRSRNRCNGLWQGNQPLQLRDRRRHRSIVRGRCTCQLRLTSRCRQQGQWRVGSRLCAMGFPVEGMHLVEDRWIGTLGRYVSELSTRCDSVVQQRQAARSTFDGGRWEEIQFRRDGKSNPRSVRRSSANVAYALAGAV